MFRGSAYPPRTTEVNPSERRDFHPFLMQCLAMRSHGSISQDLATADPEDVGAGQVEGTAIIRWRISCDPRESLLGKTERRGREAHQRAVALGTR